MAFSLKKLLTGAVAQVNPFDNGKTWDTVQRNVQPTQATPATLPTPGQAPANFKTTQQPAQRSLWSRALDQANPFDNGRTWENATPKVKDPFQEAAKLNIHDFTGNNTKVNDQIMPDRAGVLTINAKDKKIGGKVETDAKSFADSFSSFGKSYKQAYVQQALELAKQGDKEALNSLTILGRAGLLNEDATNISATNPVINVARAAGGGLMGGMADIATGIQKTPGLNAITPIFTAGNADPRAAAEESIKSARQQGKNAELANPTGAGGVVRQGAAMVPVLAATAVNPTAAVTTGYGQATGATYNSLRESGVDENKARGIGVATGIPAGFLAYIGAKGVLNPAPVTTGLVRKTAGDAAANTTTNLINKASQTVAGKTLTNVALRTPIEAAQGATTQVLNNAAMKAGGMDVGLLDNVGEATKANVITANVMGAGLDAGIPLVKRTTTKLVSGAKAAPGVVARGLDTPETVELRATNTRLQQQFDTASPQQRKVINQEIARNNEQIRAIKQGGYISADGKANLTSSLDVQAYKNFDDFYKDYGTFFKENGFDINAARKLYEVGQTTPAMPVGRAGTRDSSGAQTRFEQAYNVGDMVTARKAALEINDPTARNVALQSIDGGGQTTAKPKSDNPAIQAMIDRAKSAKKKLVPLNEGGYFRTPGGGKDFSDGSLIDNTPATAKSPEQQELPIVGPKLGKTRSSKETIPQTKKSGFAEGVTRSGEISPELQGKVKADQPNYKPVTNKDQQASAEALVKKGYKKAATDVTERLNKKWGTLNDQDVADSIEVIKALDAKGGKGNLQQATDIVEKLSTHLTKAGQTVQAASLLSNRTPQGLLYGAIKTLKNAGVEMTPKLEGKLNAAMKEVKATKAGTPEGDFARFKFIETVNKNTPSGAVSKGVQLWKAGLLTAPSTTAGNITANTLEQVVKRGYVDVVQTGIDQVFSAFTGKRSKSLTGRGLLSGAKEGALKGVSYFKTGYDPRNPNQKFDVREVHYSDTKAGRAAEAYTQGVFRLMGAQDQPFFYASMRNSLADQAITEAKNLGLKGDARSKFIKKFVTEPDTKALELANTEASYDVFQNKTALGERATKIKSNSALGDFLIPFSGVPSSIATRIIERTPIGAAHEIVKQVRSGKFNQRRMTQALANGTTGMVMAGAGAALVGAGEMTLGYPQDEKERKLWELEGKQAYSVKVGDKWVSLNYFQPAGVLLAAGGAYKKAIDDGESPAKALSIAAANTGKAFTEQTFLKGVSGALNAVNDPARSAARFLEQTAGSVVPNIVRSVARSADSKKREINGVVDAVQAGIPGLRNKMLEDRDTFGVGLDRPSSGWNSFLNPARPSDIKEGDDTTRELRRLYDADYGIMPTDIQKTTFGKDNKLTDDQVNQLNAQIQPKVKAAWDAIIADPRYAGLTDQEKRDTLRDASETIFGVEKKRYESENQIGAYSPSLSPEEAKKKQKLTAKQKKIAEGSGADFLASSESSSDMTPREVYEKAQSDFDEKSPDWSDVEKTKKTKELAIKKVKADYDNDTVDLHSMSKSDLWDYVSKAANGKELLDKVIALDDALVAAGIYDKSKYRDKKGRITVGPKKAAGSGGGRGGSGKKASKYGAYSLYGLAKSASSSGTDQALAAILKNARLS